MSDRAPRRDRPRRLRAAWRLAACVLHGLQALAVAVFLFPRLDAGGRQARVRWWGATMLRRLDVRLELTGEFATTTATTTASTTTPTATGGGCLLVANHVSWLDILAIQSICPRARFVSKADVKSWPLLSRVIDAGGTLYLERERKRDALRVVRQVGEALTAGGIVAVFPEGTTGDGQVLLPFHGNMLQAAIATSSAVQPVAVRYSDASDARSRAVEFVGTTTLVESMWKIALASSLTVHLQALPVQHPAGVERRALAARLRQQIATAIEAGANGSSGVGPAVTATPDLASPG